MNRFFPPLRVSEAPRTIGQLDSQYSYFIPTCLVLDTRGITRGTFALRRVSRAPPRCFSFSQGAELFRRLITWIARSGFLYARRSRCAISSRRNAPAMTLRATNMEPRLLTRNDNTVPRVAKWVVLSDTLHSRARESPLAVTAIYCERYSLHRGKRYCTVQFIRVA